jgi:hypothetical protein
VEKGLQVSDVLLAVVAAARKIERGCDCEYDYRCGRCSAVVALKKALETLDATVSTLGAQPGSEPGSEPVP